MKKKYTRPTVVKVKLSHEQAILGTCSSGVTNLKTAGTLCSNTPVCKTYDKKGDSAATS